jgi:hypothetical protein
MKKSIFLIVLLAITTWSIALLISLTNSSCSRSLSRDEIVLKSFNDTISSFLDDPKSYEFVSMKISDSITFGENIEVTKSWVLDDQTFSYKLMTLSQQSLNNYNENPALAKMFKDEILKSQNEISEYEGKIKEGETKIAFLDSISKSIGIRNGEIAAYTYIFQFRAKNKLGALILDNIYVQTTSAPDYKILNITNKEGKLFLTPNGFPGREAFKEKFK